MKYGILIIAHPHTCCRTCSSQLASVCEAKNNRILWQRGPFCDSSVKSSAFMHRYPKLTEEFHRKMRLSLAKCQPGNNTRAVSNVWAHRRIKREDWFFFPPQVDMTATNSNWQVSVCWQLRYCVLTWHLRAEIIFFIASWMHSSSCTMLMDFILFMWSIKNLMSDC